MSRSRVFSNETDFKNPRPSYKSDMYSLSNADNSRESNSTGPMPVARNSSRPFNSIGMTGLRNPSRHSNSVGTGLRNSTFSKKSSSKASISNKARKPYIGTNKPQASAAIADQSKMADDGKEGMPTWIGIKISLIIFLLIADSIMSLMVAYKLPACRANWRHGVRNMNPRNFMAEVETDTTRSEGVHQTKSGADFHPFPKVKHYTAEHQETMSSEADHIEHPNKGQYMKKMDSENETVLAKTKSTAQSTKTNSKISTQISNFHKNTLRSKFTQPGVLVPPHTQITVAPKEVTNIIFTANVSHLKVVSGIVTSKLYTNKAVGPFNNYTGRRMTIHSSKLTEIVPQPIKTPHVGLEAKQAASVTSPDSATKQKNAYATSKAVLKEKSRSMSDRHMKNTIIPENQKRTIQLKRLNTHLPNSTAVAIIETKKSGSSRSMPVIEDVTQLNVLTGKIRYTSIVLVTPKPSSEISSSLHFKNSETPTFMAITGSSKQTTKVENTTDKVYVYETSKNGKGLKQMTGIMTEKIHYTEVMVESEIPNISTMHLIFPKITGDTLLANETIIDKIAPRATNATNTLIEGNFGSTIQVYSFSRNIKDGSTEKQQETLAEHINFTEIITESDMPSKTNLTEKPKYTSALVFKKSSSPFKNLGGIENTSIQSATASNNSMNYIRQNISRKTITELINCTEIITEPERQSREYWTEKFKNTNGTEQSPLLQSVSGVKEAKTKNTSQKFPQGISKGIKKNRTTFAVDGNPPEEQSFTSTASRENFTSTAFIETKMAANLGSQEAIKSKSTSLVISQDISKRAEKLFRKKSTTAVAINSSNHQAKDTCNTTASIERTSRNMILHNATVSNSLKHYNTQNTPEKTFTELIKYTEIMTELGQENLTRMWTFTDVPVKQSTLLNNSLGLTKTKTESTLQKSPQNMYEDEEKIKRNKTTINLETNQPEQQSSSRTASKSIIATQVDKRNENETTTAVDTNLLKQQDLTSTAPRATCTTSAFFEQTLGTNLISQNATFSTRFKKYISQNIPQKTFTELINYTEIITEPERKGLTSQSSLNKSSSDVKETKTERTSQTFAEGITKDAEKYIENKTTFAVVDGNLSEQQSSATSTTIAFIEPKVAPTLTGQQANVPTNPKYYDNITNTPQRTFTVQINFTEIITEPGRKNQDYLAGKYKHTDLTPGTSVFKHLLSVKSISEQADKLIRNETTIDVDTNLPKSQAITRTAPRATYTPTASFKQTLGAILRPQNATVSKNFKNYIPQNIPQKTFTEAMNFTEIITEPESSTQKYLTELMLTDVTFEQKYMHTDLTSETSLFEYLLGVKSTKPKITSYALYQDISKQADKLIKNEAKIGVDTNLPKQKTITRTAARATYIPTPAFKQTLGSILISQSATVSKNFKNYISQNIPQKTFTELINYTEIVKEPEKRSQKYLTEEMKLTDVTLQQSSLLERSSGGEEIKTERTSQTYPQGVSKDAEKHTESKTTFAVDGSLPQQQFSTRIAKGTLTTIEFTKPKLAPTLTSTNLKYYDNSQSSRQRTFTDQINFTEIITEPRRQNQDYLTGKYKHTDLTSETSLFEYLLDVKNTKSKLTSHTFYQYISKQADRVIRNETTIDVDTNLPKQQEIARTAPRATYTPTASFKQTLGAILISQNATVSKNFKNYIPQSIPQKTFTEAMNYTEIITEPKSSTQKYLTELKLTDVTFKQKYKHTDLTSETSLFDYFVDIKSTKPKITSYALYQDNSKQADKLIKNETTIGVDTDLPRQQTITRTAARAAYIPTASFKQTLSAILISENATVSKNLKNYISQNIPEKTFTELINYTEIVKEPEKRSQKYLTEEMKMTDVTFKQTRLLESSSGIEEIKTERTSQTYTQGVSKDAEKHIESKTTFAVDGSLPQQQFSTRIAQGTLTTIQFTKPKLAPTLTFTNLKYYDNSQNTPQRTFTEQVNFTQTITEPGIQMQEYRTGNNKNSGLTSGTSLFDYLVDVKKTRMNSTTETLSGDFSGRADKLMKNNMTSTTPKEIYTSTASIGRKRRTNLVTQRATYIPQNTLRKTFTELINYTEIILEPEKKGQKYQTKIMKLTDVTFKQNSLLENSSGETKTERTLQILPQSITINAENIIGNTTTAALNGNLPEHESLACSASEATSMKQKLGSKLTQNTTVSKNSMNAISHSTPQKTFTFMKSYTEIITEPEKQGRIYLTEKLKYTDVAVIQSALLENATALKEPKTEISSPTLSQNTFEHIETVLETRLTNALDDRSKKPTSISLAVRANITDASIDQKLDKDSIKQIESVSEIFRSDFSPKNSQGASTEQINHTEINVDLGRQSPEYSSKELKVSGQINSTQIITEPEKKSSEHSTEILEVTNVSEERTHQVHMLDVKAKSISKKTFQDIYKPGSTTERFIGNKSMNAVDSNPPGRQTLTIEKLDTSYMTQKTSATEYVENGIYQDTAQRTLTKVINYTEMFTDTDKQNQEYLSKNHEFNVATSIQGNLLAGENMNTQCISQSIYQNASKSSSSIQKLPTNSTIVSEYSIVEKRQTATVPKATYTTTALIDIKLSAQKASPPKADMDDFSRNIQHEASNAQLNYMEGTESDKPMQEPMTESPSFSSKLQTSYKITFLNNTEETLTIEKLDTSYMTQKTSATEYVENGIYQDTAQRTLTKVIDYTEMFADTGKQSQEYLSKKHDFNVATSIEGNILAGENTNIKRISQSIYQNSTKSPSSTQKLPTNAAIVSVYSIFEKSQTATVPKATALIDIALSTQKASPSKTHEDDFSRNIQFEKSTAQLNYMEGTESDMPLQESLTENRSFSSKLQKDYLDENSIAATTNAKHTSENVKTKFTRIETQNDSPGMNAENIEYTEIIAEKNYPTRKWECFTKSYW